MIVFDTETTGLIDNPAKPLDFLPYIIEFGAIKIDDRTLKEVDRINFLIKPPITIPSIVTRITGISDNTVRDEPTFPEVLPDIRKFYLGEDTMVAHNIPFDRNMLSFELRRMGCEFKFPWPFNHICTSELSKSFNEGRFMKLEKLYELVHGKNPKQTHRAVEDCEILCSVIPWLRSKFSIEVI